MLVVGILRIDLHPLNSRSSSDLRDVDIVLQRRPLRVVDAAIAARRYCVHSLVVGIAKGGPEDGFVGAFVEPIGADRVDEDVGGCSGPAPDVGKVACRIRSRLGRTIVLAGGNYIGGRNGAIVKKKFRGQLSFPGSNVPVLL